MIAEYAQQKGKTFSLKSFLDEFFAKGLIPQSLIHWEMTGYRN